MPDITMCGNELCGVRDTCYRNPASGTKPAEHRQPWFLIDPEDNFECNYYWPVEDRK